MAPACLQFKDLLRTAVGQSLVENADETISSFKIPVCELLTDNINDLRMYLDELSKETIAQLAQQDCQVIGMEGELLTSKIIDNILSEPSKSIPSLLCPLTQIDTNPKSHMRHIDNKRILYWCEVFNDPKECENGKICPDWDMNSKITIVPNISVIAQKRDTMHGTMGTIRGGGRVIALLFLAFLYRKCGVTPPLHLQVLFSGVPCCIISNKCLSDEREKLLHFLGKLYRINMIKVTGINYERMGIMGFEKTIKNLIWNVAGYMKDSI